MRLFQATLENGQQTSQIDRHRSNVSRQCLSRANLCSAASCDRSFLETLHLVLSAHGVWQYTIVDRANPALMGDVVW